MIALVGFFVGTTCIDAAGKAIGVVSGVLFFMVFPAVNLVLADGEIEKTAASSIWMGMTAAFMAMKQVSGDHGNLEEHKSL